MYLLKLSNCKVYIRKREYNERLINKNIGIRFTDIGAYVCEFTNELNALAKAKLGHYEGDTEFILRYICRR